MPADFIEDDYRMQFSSIGCAGLRYTAVEEGAMLLDGFGENR